MRLILMGLIVGGAGGLLLQKYMLAEDGGARRTRRTTEAEEGVPKPRTAPADGNADLLARIAELEALLAAAQPPAESLFGEIQIPTTDEGIEQLMEEFQRSDDLDRLLALLEALLLQGEKGYPRLTKLLLRVVGKGMANKFREEDLLQRVIPALRMGMRHEKKLVGYVGYLLTDENVPSMMRTGAMAAAMFFSVNGVAGSEAFSGKLLEQFMASSQGQGGGGLMGGEQASMLIGAMGMLQQKEAVEPLLRMMEDPEHGGNMWQIVEALGRIGDERAVPALITRLAAKTGSDDEWWAPELTALGRIGTPEATSAAEQYLRGLTDDSRFFSQVGSYLSTRPGSAKMVGLIRDRYRANPGSQHLWNAVWGLRNSNTPEATALLEEISTTATAEAVREHSRSILSERRKMAEALVGELGATER